jgi:hypothetical protein
VLRALAEETLNEDDIHQVSDSEDPEWKSELFLRQSDKEILQKHNEWLNDRLMYAAMLLLKDQFKHIHGFRDPIMVSALRCNFPGDVFVQVVFHGSDHWITVSNMHCRPGVVRIYDSMHLFLSVTVKQQLAALCQSSEAVLTMQSMNVARQVGTGDCGLLAIAYATSLCLGQDPVNVIYEQNKLRPHYLNCLNNGRMETFPVIVKRTVRNPVAFQIAERVHCICRQLYVRGCRMIQCNSCHTWYHAACIALSDSAFSQAAEQTQFSCQLCIANVE